MTNNLDQLILEIKSRLKKYDEAGLLDEIAMRRDATLALRGFGQTLTFQTDAVLELEDGIAYLPEAFFSLQSAELCTPKGYAYTGSQDSLQSSYMYRERVERSREWTECNSCCENKTEKVIRENIYFDGGSIEFYYKTPILLSLGRSFDKSKCSPTCSNLRVNDPREISIIGNKIQANFKEGYIYIRYHSLPVDQDGEVDIPEITDGKFHQYMEYFLLRRSAERLIEDGNALPGLSNLYSGYLTLERQHKATALTAAKMKSLTPQVMKKMKAKNRIETLKYEIKTTWH